MWNIEMVTKEYGCGPLLPSDVEVGYLIVDSHQKVTDAVSPTFTSMQCATLLINNPHISYDCFLYLVHRRFH